MTESKPFESNTPRHELDRSEERFRLLVESVVDYAIFVLDPDGTISTWNSGAERLKGYTEDEVVGQHYSLFYPEEYRAENLPERLLAEAREEGRVEHSGWRVRKDGTRFWANVVITALWDDGKLAGFAKVTRDMTEAHEAQEHREQSLRRLEELDEWRREFISAITHDLRNPVVSILGFVRLLQEGGLDDSDVDHFHERILSNALTLNALLEHLRTHAMLESGEITLELEPLDVGEVVAAVVADMEPVLGGHDVEIAVEGLRVTADRRGLERVARNLLSNAARHTPPASRIRVSGEKRGDEVAVAVEDQGEGISEDRLSRVFDRFERGDGGGSGLGLAIVKQYVELHHGRVSVESQPGEGTIVRFTLPAA